MQPPQIKPTVLEKERLYPNVALDLSARANSGL
ncbi:unnamed protein product, partial [marine sediment metagenome]